MNCAGCGRDNLRGARFCVHCGAEQTAPIAAIAGSMTSRAAAPMPSAANAPSADAGSVPSGTESPYASRPAPWRVADTQTPAFPPDRDPPAARASGGAGARPPAAGRPTYASQPRRAGLAALLIALCVATALVAFAIWKFSRDAQPADAVAEPETDRSVMSAYPPEATPPRATPAPESPATPAPPPAVDGSQATPAGADAEAAPPSAPPVEIKSLPAKPAARRSAGVAAPPKTLTAPPPAPVVAEPAPVRPPVVVPAPRASPPDRWTQMRDEQSRCTREDFIARVICDQRVRFRYCNGYWGKTPQCPGSPAPERGQ